MTTSDEQSTSSQTSSRKRRPQHEQPVKADDVTSSTSPSSSVNDEVMLNVNHEEISSHSSRRTPMSTPPIYQTPSTSRHETVRFHSSSQRYAGSSHHRRQTRHAAASFGSPFQSPPVSLFDNEEGGGRQEERQQPQRHAQHYQTSYDSPFLSPFPNNTRQKERPQPLVLDPSAKTPTASTHIRPPETSAHSTRSLPLQLLQAATTSLQQHHATKMDYQGSNIHHSTPSIRNHASASSLAQQAAMAGYLLKLGQTIPEFKRRFFFLRSETNLYYYLSPNDVEPRGRIDLEGSTINVVEQLPDGRLRFQVEWGNDNDKPNIVLEARSQQIGEEWIKVMQQERVSTLKTQVDALTGETTAQKNRIIDLEQQLAHYAKVEEDRDGALEDAQNWRSRFEKLDEALRLLTQQVRQAPKVEESGAGAADDTKNEQSTDVSYSTGEEEKKEDDGDDSNDNENEKSINDTSNATESTPTQSNLEKAKPAALLDDFLQHDNMNVEEMLEVPGTYFSSLSNACRQQKESLRLAYVEASTAVEDVVKANERVEAVEKRMQKAEKQLLKLWEENCTIRNSLKQKKREKRVLVKEVKHLQETVTQMQEDSEKRENLRLYDMKVAENDGPMADTIIGSDEERLIDELEAHVASSIKLHERLLVGNDVVVENETDLNTSLDESIFTADHGSIYRTVTAETANEAPTSVRQSGPIFRDTKPSGEKLLSLFDDDEDSDSESSMGATEELKPVQLLEDLYSVAPSVSSTLAEMGDHEDRTNRLVPSSSSVDSPEGTPNRSNPLLQLDSDEPSEHLIFEPQRSPTAITKNGRATTRLACPLADVVDTKANAKPSFDQNEEHQVQHLTFYSQKIGIQFQKAPPAPVKPRGLLTEALTADLVGGESNDSQRQAVQLQSIASIASFANGRSSSREPEHCPLALPEDIVLVCGFQGFDDSGTNQRPKLGARLVAFDGVSVEVGKWTFDSIRKAIKMRGRPLTLSFRNDFLTTEQRAVLTKAVMDVDAKTPKNMSMSSSGFHDRHPSASVSVHSGLSHETDNFVNTSRHQQFQIHRRSDSEHGGNTMMDSNHQGSWSQSQYYHPPPSSNSSLSGSEPPMRRRLSSNTSVSTSNHHNNPNSNFRSFSDAGSSVVSTSLAPLMANLLKGVSHSSSEHSHRRFEPEYLRREPERLDRTPQHQDFQSNLL